MATTLNNLATENQQTTYTLLVIFTVDANSHDHLQDQQMIRNEAASWMASLNANVRGVSIRKAD